MTASEFYKFQNLQTFYAYKLSDGSYHRDSGIFKITSYDTWYLVFLNADSDMQTTYLIYNFEVERAVDFTPIIVTIAIIAVCLIISILIVVAYRRKKKREEQPVYVPIQPHLSRKPVTTTKSQKNNTIKFCTQCGTPQPMDAIYCVKCGNRLVS
ncbi:MAG: zinc-ribbon domain-containing protein [Promethearchaeota archaeon]